MSFSNLTCDVNASLELNRLRENQLFTIQREQAYLQTVTVNELYDYVYNPQRIGRIQSEEIEAKLIEAEKSLNPNASEFEVYQIILNLN